MRGIFGVIVLLIACAAASYLAARMARCNPSTRRSEIASYRSIPTNGIETSKVKVVLKAYDLEPIVDAVLAHNTSIMQELYGNLTAYSGCFGDPVQRRPRIEVAEEVLALIRDTVDTNSWLENGGTVGGMRVFDMAMIVDQTEENHREIARCLDLLNRIILRDRHAKTTIIETQP